jgi:hypothetical protein
MCHRVRRGEVWVPLPAESLVICTYLTVPPQGRINPPTGPFFALAQPGPLVPPYAPQASPAHAAFRAVVPVCGRRTRAARTARTCLNPRMSRGNAWVRDLCRAVEQRRERSYVEMFEVARPHLDESDFEERVREQLASEPGLVESWEVFSGDNRGSPASYLDGNTVGRYDGGNQDVVVHANRIEAAADFIHRRAVEILTHRRLAKGE